MTIIFKDVAKSYNGKMVFEKITGKINEKDKVGIVGVNGVGKSTLLKMLMGIEDRDYGEIAYFPEKIKFGYLNQYNDFDSNLTVYDELYNAGMISRNSNFNMDSYKKRLKKLLNKIEFGEDYYNMKASDLSGGEKTKLSICKILVESPDVLVLDEPTNHLDVETINWLENFLQEINKTTIIISHDRVFLDNTVNKIFEMKKDFIKAYKGNYSEYKMQKEVEDRHQEIEFQKQQREIKHLKEIISERKGWYENAHKAAGQNDFLRSKAKKHTSIIKSKEKQLERLEKNKINKPAGDIVAAFDYINGVNKDSRKLPEYIIKVNNICKSFDNKVILENTLFNIRKGEKIALIGKNGSGKSTLIKLIMNRQKVDSGDIYINPSVKIGYFAQELENLNFQNSILDEILKEGVNVQSARLMMACLLFKGEDVYKKIEFLSMGEKCRVVFGKLILSNADVLVLDEPTNYMDIVSREKIEEVIEMYKGTLLLVSHDRYFVKRVANKIFEIEDRKVKIYDGDLQYYLSKKNSCQDKKKLKNCLNIKDEIVKLECEIAFISGKLDDMNINPQEKRELNNRFIETSRKLNEYK